MVVVGGKVGGSSLLLLLNQTPPPALDKLYKSNALTPTPPSSSRRRRRSCSSRWVARVPVVRALGPDGGDAVSSSSSSSSSSKKKVVSSSNYVVPFDSSSSCITRPLVEILRDLNKRIPDSIIIKPTALPQDQDHDQAQAAAAADQNQNQNQDQDQDDHHHTSKTYIPWYHANRMLSFYAPGWCGEIRDVIFSDNGSVTVVYRVTIRGSDGEAHRESTGTVSQPMDGHVDAVAAAEEIAFCRACARFGLGLYLYHDE